MIYNKPNPNQLQRKHFLVSFYTTVYNNAPYIEKSLHSTISVCSKLKKKYGIDSEIVVVDNYSDDGTYEKMVAISKEANCKGINIAIYRVRCRRGLGRQIALTRTKGNYLFFITDMDLVYERFLADVIAWYLMNDELRRSAFYLYLMPREYAIKVGGINDLNRTEDIEFAARIARHYRILPVLKPFSYGLLDKPFMRAVGLTKSKQRFFIYTYVSERRYAKSILGYLRREFGNKIDMIRGMGLTPLKIVRELWFLRKYRGIMLIIALAYHLLFWFITKMMHLPIYSHNQYINNGSYVDYKMFINYVELVKELVKKEAINSNDAKHYILEYLRGRKIRGIVEYMSRFEGKALW